MNTPSPFAASHIGLPLAALLGARAASDPLPSRLQLFKMGENHTSQGIFLVDDQAIASLAAVQHRIGREQVAIGFEHNIDSGSAEYQRTQEPRAVAAKAATVEGVPGSGIFLSAINWTPEGQASYGHFEDLSPTPLYNKSTRRIYGILSASLVRAGAVYGLSLDASAAAAQLSAMLPEQADNGVTGFDRVMQAFARENAAREQREARLSSVRPAIDPALTGMARVIAANQRDNEQKPAWRQYFAPKP